MFVCIKWKWSSESNSIQNINVWNDSLVDVDIRYKHNGNICMCDKIIEIYKWKYNISYCYEHGI